MKHFFLRGIHLRKYVKFARSKIKRVSRLIILGAFNKGNFPLFDKSLMTPGYLHQTMLSFKGIRFCLMFGSNHKKVFEKLEKSPYLSPS